MIYDHVTNEWYETKMPPHLKKISILSQRSQISQTKINSIMAHHLSEPFPTKNNFIRSAEGTFNRLGYFVPPDELATIYELVQDQI